MKKLVVFIALAVLSKQSKAIELRSTGANYENLVRYLVSNVVKPILTSRFDERTITDSIIILVDPSIGTLNSMKAAVSIPGNPRKIVISDGFIYGLEQYIAADLISREMSDPHLAERYFNYLFWRQRPVNDGDYPVSVEEWSEYHPSNQDSFNKNKLTLLVLALTDVLLHEVGHHVTDGFYNEHTSKERIRTIERKADEWSQEALSEEAPGATAIGRTYSVGYIYELERLTGFSGSQTHPPHMYRTFSTIDDLCSAVGKDRKELCKRLKQDTILRFRADASEEEYRLRIDNGEDYAHFPLANILLAQGKKKEACEHYIRAWHDANVERASIHVGSCYDNEYLEDKSNTTALREAKKYYGIAADLGFVDAKVYIRKFFR